MRASTVNLFKLSQEAIGENMEASVNNDRMLAIRTACINIAKANDDYTPSKASERSERLSKIDDILFQQSLVGNGLVT